MYIHKPGFLMLSHISVYHFINFNSHPDKHLAVGLSLHPKVVCFTQAVTARPDHTLIRLYYTEN